jgi:hypothetical protein
LGDEILKTIRLLRILFLVSTFIVGSFGAATKLSLGNETKAYDKIFEKISETRIGADIKKINKLKNPFLVIYKKRSESNETKKPKILYILDGIFEKKAKINGKWMKKHSRVGEYKLVKVKHKSVVLQNSNGTKELFIRKNNGSKIKFTTK